MFFLLLTLFACPAPPTQETGAPPPADAPSEAEATAAAPDGV